MPVWVFAALSAFVALLLLVALGTVGFHFYSARKEAIAEARSSYEVAFEAYEYAQSRLEKELSDAQTTLDGFDADDLDDGSLLDGLESELADAQAVFDSSGNRADFDLAAGSVTEVNTETDDVGIAASDMDEAADGLSAAEKKVRDSFDAKAEADAEKRRAEEEKQAKEDASTISYQELFRAGDSLTGKYFTFEGQIVQTIGMGQYRVNVTREPGYTRDFWSDTVMLTVMPEADVKLLEDDIISFTAKSDGTMTYETVFGASVEIPAVLADGADVSLKD